MNIVTRPLSKLFIGLATLVASPLFGQGFAQGDRVPLPVDWSFSHVIYSQSFTPAQAARMQHDPRLYNSWLLQGHVQSANTQGGKGKPQPPPPTQPGVDWSFSLGAGGVAQNMFPAKYNFNVNAALTSA